MDIFKEFEEYLPQWSEEKHLPIPTQEHMDRWAIAWDDFVKEHLVKKRKELVQSYKDMQYKTVGDAKREKMVSEEIVEPLQVVMSPSEEVVQPVEPFGEELSPWEQVQAILAKDTE